MLTESASCDVTPGEVVQRGEAILTHRVDVILKDSIGFQSLSEKETTLYLVKRENSGDTDNVI